ncbi:single-stranded DNA-binding protein [Staphylococcus xylosus]|uniref:ERF family protein n=1 Tax=Staphylococcus xylosus TaxID=1288 RepID=UPI000D1D4DCD|nr:ERF family protein [Staphylococcus xylosus]PTH92919.1 single-stranded DNA-binding protein [Staphylococcus xylosus]
MSETKNIHQRINEAKHSMEGFIKDKAGYQYSYVSGSQVLHKLNPELYKHGINITFKTSDAKYETVNVVVKGKEKQEYVVSLNVHYTITNTDKSEEKIESTIFAIGQQDDPSKALGTALTYSERYFLMKFFGLPTDEDDADAKEKREAYSKADNSAQQELNNEIQDFTDLLNSQGDDISFDEVKQKFQIGDISRLSQSDVSGYISLIRANAQKRRRMNND